MSTEHFRLPAGWYADEQTSGERWWNGSQWTSHTRAGRADTSGTQRPVLEGQPPAAWSASDAPLATVFDEGVAPTGGAYESTEIAAPVPLAVAPGWYPDPQGLPAQRWWDGARWSGHTAPVAGYSGHQQGAYQQGGYQPGGYQPAGYRPGGGTAVHVAYGGTAVVVVPPRKSVGVALLLTFFFGPFGMFYSTVTGALIMLAVLFVGGFVVGVLTLGLAWLFWGPLVWFASMVWGCLAASQATGTPVVSHYR